MENYDRLIHEVSELIDVPLSIGSRGQIVLEVDGIVTIHIEQIIQSSSVRVAALLYTLPPDVVRERVLISTLKANARAYPQYGTFAFSSKRSALVLFEQMRLSDLQPEPFCNFLEQFILKAKKWIDALNRGKTEPEDFIQVSGGPSGIFGLK